MKAFDRVIQEPAAELKTLTMERLNHMLMVHWSKAVAGDIAATQMVLSIQDRITKLQGLDAPIQQQISMDVQGAILVIDGDKDQYIAHMQRMAGIEAMGDTALPSGLPELMVGDDSDSDIIDAEVIEVPQPVKKNGKRRMVSKEGVV